MIQSLYIVTEARGEPVLQKHWRGVVHRGAVDLFWSEVQKAGSPQDVLPVIATPKYYIVSISRHGLFYVTTVQMEFPPLMVIEFLHRYILI
jgi:AP-3 complex subunit mu